MAVDVTPRGPLYMIHGSPIIWAPQRNNHQEIGQCPSDWDELWGAYPMEAFGTYIVHCEKAECLDARDWTYTLLPGSDNPGSCGFSAVSTDWLGLISVSGFCTGEAAEYAYFRKTSAEINVQSGSLTIQHCGFIEGCVVYGIEPPEELIACHGATGIDGCDDLPGSPIEEFLANGVNPEIQVFGCGTDDYCGDLGFGGNWASDPDLPGYSWVEVVDPMGLKCPNLAGHPDLDGVEFEYPNFALPSYEITGGCTKYDRDGIVEYSLSDFTFWVNWVTDPPVRPKWGEFPERHTDQGAWIAEVEVDYDFSDGWGWFETVPMILELVWYQKHGIWMIVLYHEDGKPSWTPNRSLWFDVFVNPSLIGPCRLGLAQSDSDRTFRPLRTEDTDVIDGEFLVELPDVPI